MRRHFQRGADAFQVKLVVRQGQRLLDHLGEIERFDRKQGVIQIASTPGLWR
jgi:hypothetical protein